MCVRHVFPDRRLAHAGLVGRGFVCSSFSLTGDLLMQAGLVGMVLCLAIVRL